MQEAQKESKVAHVGPKSHSTPVTISAGDDIVGSVVAVGESWGGARGAEGVEGRPRRPEKSLHPSYY